MTALVDTRAPTQPKRTIARYHLPLAASVTVYKGADVMVIRSGTGQGYFAPADDARIGRSLAKALETVTNSGAAGAATCLCEFYHERTIWPFGNDSNDPLDATDREGPAYTLDDQTVSGTVSTAAAGVLFEIDSAGVAWVDKDANYAMESMSDLSDVAPVDPSSTSASAGSANAAARQDHKHHLALATTSAEGLLSAADKTILNHLAAPTEMLFDKQAADSDPLTSVLAEHSIYVAPTGDTFSAFYVVADAGLTGDATNNAVLTIKKRDGAGGASSSVAALTTTTNWTAFVPKSLGAVSGGALAVGAVLTLTITKGGSGVSLPAFKLYGIKAVA